MSAARAAALLAALGLALFLLGCTAQGASEDGQQRHGFYGGIEGGGSRI
jgi:hypothetical protein